MTGKPSEWYKDVGLLILRLGIGINFIVFHGWGKLMSGPEGWARTGEAVSHLGIEFGFTIWGLLAALTETLGGLFFALGLFFRPVCLMLFIMMAVAVNFHIGRGDGWDGAAHALKAGVLFFSTIFIGPGRYSLDALIFGRRKKPEASPEGMTYDMGSFGTGVDSGSKPL